MKATQAKPRTQGDPELPSWGTKARRGVIVLVALAAALVSIFSVTLGPEIGCRSISVDETTNSGASSSEKDIAGSTTKQPGDENSSSRELEQTKTQPTSTQKNSTTKTCDGFTTGMLLPFALLIVVLLLPDLTEFAIPGVLSLKIKVEQQAAEVEKQGERQTELERQLISLRMNVTQNQATTVVVNLDNLMRSVDAKADAFPDAATRPEGMIRAITESDPTISRDIALTVVEFLQIAEQLRTYAQTGSELALGEPQQAALRRWRSLFTEEIAAILGIRNRLAHGHVDMALEQIQEVVAIARKLQDVLVAAIENPPDA